MNLLRALTCRCRPLALAAALLGTACLPATAAGNDPSRPANGITQLDLLGDGTPAMMVVGRRENFNAHSFDVATLYVRVDGTWQLVPLFDGDQEHDTLTSSGGADCLLHDFRLVRAGHAAPLALVLADRDYGESFVDNRPVTFRHYALVKNADGTPGAPTWSFHLQSTQVSGKAYCDVGDAFEKEAAWRR